MLNINHVLVPVNSSDASATAVPVAVRMARLHGARLEMFHVTDDRRPLEDHGGPPERYVSERTLEGVDVARVEERAAAVAPAILSRAAAADTDLVVMGTHGRQGLRRLIVGSVTEEVVREAPCPVLAVRPNGADRKAANGFERILVAIDFSETGAVAFEHAAELAATCGSRLHVLHVIQPESYPEFYYPLLSGFGDALPRLRREVEMRLLQLIDDERMARVRYARRWVEIGRPADRIVDLARRLEADLVVLGSHGRSGLDRLLIGSVAGDVLRLSDCPVLVVPATGKRLMVAMADTEHDVETVA